MKLCVSFRHAAGVQAHIHLGGASTHTPICTLWRGTQLNCPAIKTECTVILHSLLIYEEIITDLCEEKTSVCFWLYPHSSPSTKFAWQFLQLVFDLFLGSRTAFSWLTDNELQEATDWMSNTKPQLVHCDLEMSNDCAGVLIVNRC